MIKYIDKIYTFLVVYEKGSFSSASKKLNISQPAVTQQIKQLEEYIGAKLIERKKNGVILTKKGKYFLEIAINLKDCVEKVSNRIQYFKDKYDEELPPLWVCVEFMTLGEISKWYKNLNLEDNSDFKITSGYILYEIIQSMPEKMFKFIFSE